MTVRMERHLTWLVLWVLLALQAGCKEQPKPQPPPPPKVTVAQPVQQAVTDSLDLTGNTDRKSTRLNSSHGYISYAVFCLKKKKNTRQDTPTLLELTKLVS